jgi:hypothetical protein
MNARVLQTGLREPIAARDVFFEHACDAARRARSTATAARD